MPNQYVNKVIYAGNTLIDLTADTVTAADVLSGKTFHLKTGASATGSCTYDSDTTDATASASEILNTKTAYVNKTKVTGTMPNRGGVTGTISTKAQQYTIQSGYHDGSGKVSISSTEQAKLIAENIREGVTILGVEGSMSGTEEVVAGSPTVTPTTTDQIIVPDSTTTPPQNYLSQVTVLAIPYSETDNSAGGKTVEIAGSAA